MRRPIYLFKIGSYNFKAHGELSGLKVLLIFSNKTHFPSPQFEYIGWPT